MAKFKLGDTFQLHIDDIITEVYSDGSSKSIYVDSRIPFTQFNEDELEILSLNNKSNPSSEPSNSDYKIGDTFSVRIKDTVIHTHSDGKAEKFYILDGIDNYYFDSTDLDYFREVENAVT